jgi:thioredoxin reductase
VTGLAVADGRLAGVALADGTVVECRALVVTPRFTARAGVLRSLGLPTVPVERDGMLLGTRAQADPWTGATALPGVWAAGNVTAPTEKLAGAAAAGERAGAAINADLVEAETRRALAAHRTRRGPGPQAPVPGGTSQR